MGLNLFHGLLRAYVEFTVGPMPNLPPVAGDVRGYHSFPGIKVTMYFIHQLHGRGTRARHSSTLKLQ